LLLKAYASLFLKDYASRASIDSRMQIPADQGRKARLDDLKAREN